MHIIICGSGQSGYNIAERLTSEEVDVTIIDQNNKLIDKIRETLDVCGFVGHASNPDVLAAAGAAEADMIIAVTLHDEINMIACQVAHSLFKIPTKIARIRSQFYLDLKYQNLFSRDNLPIDIIISPELEIAETVLRRITHPGAIDVLLFADDNITVLGIECLDDCPIVDTPLRQLTGLFPDLYTTIVGVIRKKNLFIPTADDLLKKGDVVYVTSMTDQVKRTCILFGHKNLEIKRVVIAGGGNIGFYIARFIEKKYHNKIKSKIIECDKNRAFFISDQLNNTSILNGSALDKSILQQAITENTDIMISVTNQEQVNILSAMIAKRFGCKSNMVLINDSLYEDLTKKNGIDTYVSPRNIIVSKILQQIRKGRIRALYSVFHGKAEVIEAQALETSPLVGKTIANLSLSKKIRFGAIYRDNRIIRPTGSECIHPGDWVVIFYLIDAVHDVEKMFRVSLDFF